MSYGDKQQAWDYPVRTNAPGNGSGAEEICWRPWPCDQCRKGTTAFDFLRHRQETSGEFPKEEWDEIVNLLQSRERGWLIEWTRSCKHSEDHHIATPELARGSEHAVYLEASSASVIKVTLPNCYGNFNYFEGQTICQAQSTPLLYLNRLRLWRNTFGNAPSAIGVTPDGRIVTKQKFILGDLPTQKQVDEYLLSAGMTPVRQNCFLWKSQSFPDASEVWVGDARDENFVLSAGEIVPIDIRLWWTNS